jgi:hypothetical protein
MAVADEYTTLDIFGFDKPFTDARLPQTRTSKPPSSEIALISTFDLERYR